MKAIASTRLNQTAQLIFRYKTTKKKNGTVFLVDASEIQNTQPHAHQISRRNH